MGGKRQIADTELSIAFVAKHIFDSYHSRHLQERDRQELSLLLRLATYEEHYSPEDKSRLLSRLQQYAVVVTAGWKTAVSTSKRAELTIWDLAPQFSRQQFFKRRGNARSKASP